MVTIDPARVQDERYIKSLDNRYKEVSNILVDKYIPGLEPQVKTLLISYIVNMMLGLGDLEVLIADDGLEEVAVNGASDYLWVFHKELGWCKTNIKPRQRGGRSTSSRRR